VSQLVVFAFRTESGAQEVLGVVDRLQRQGLITLDDAATVERDQHGKPRVRQATSVVGVGALGGAFWGLLLGLLFFAPWFGLAVGAMTGALTGRFKDFGIEDGFIRRVGESVQPGQSALFLLVHEAKTDRVLEAIQPYHPQVLETTLSAEQEARLREAFGGAAGAAVPSAPAPPGNA
jgi:uncharacterized membrane protein